MTLTLSDVQIARLVGAQAYARGARLAEHGHVGRTTWSPNGARVFGTVEGSGAHSYVSTVSFQQSASGGLSEPVGSCTCPVAINCKHVAALLLATRTDTYEETPQTTVRFKAVGAVDTAPRGPSWQSALGPLTRREERAVAAAPLALQLELLAPRRNWRLPVDPLAPPRLGARPVTMGKRGKWIKGNLNWNGLGYGYGFERTQQRALASLHEHYAESRGYDSYAEDWIFLEDFAGTGLWDLLIRARDAGVAIVTADSAQSAVDLADAAAELSIDLSRSGSGLALTPSFTLAGEPLEARRLIMLGDPARVVASWTVPEATAGRATPRGAAAAAVMPPSIRLTLAELSAPISRDIRELAAADTPLFIPSDDEALFGTSYYPFLREQLTLTSTDNSFELAAAPRPVLALGIIGDPAATAGVTISWQWAYHGADAGQSAPDFVRRLHPAPGEGDYRDITRENEILAPLAGLVERFPQLADGAPRTARLAETATLAGARMIAFLAEELPWLRASDSIAVTMADALPRYREATEAPLITVATHARAGERDWFDLAVDVSVDGQVIPFDELITALATEQELMILPDGVWFGLDRPELHQLRALIEEARSLQDSAGDGLGISRFQADLWEELQELGVVTAQAEAWRNAVEALASDAQILPQPVPATVHATLRGYQQQGFDWLSFLYDRGLGGVLADDMGLGKTLQAIALIAHTRSSAQTPAGAPDAASESHPPFLVVAPTSVVPNWASECAKFAPSLRVVTITTTSAKRATALADLVAGADVVITSYTLFRLDFDEYQGQVWAGLLLDEAQFVKNHQSRAHQCARRLDTPFKLAITGTPLENNLMELWSLFSITAPGLFPSPRKFADFYQAAIEKDGNEERLAQLRRRIRPFMMRRTKDQVASDLPAKQEQVLELDLHPKHRKVYQTHLQRERQKVLGLIDDMNANRFEIFRSLTMLRQLSLDASLYDEKYADVPSTKLDALMEMLDDTVAEGHRTLIFSQFTGYLAKARARLDAAGVAYSYLDGKTRNRAKTIAEFKEGRNPVFLISLKAGGFGLNLTEADYVVLLDPWWNPATEAQAVDRTHRIGQTKNVMVYRLVSRDTIEEKVMALKLSKSQLFDSVMADGATSSAALSASDIRSLLE